MYISPLDIEAGHILKRSPVPRASILHRHPLMIRLFIFFPRVHLENFLRFYIYKDRTASSIILGKREVLQLGIPEHLEHSEVLE